MVMPRRHSLGIPRPSLRHPDGDSGGPRGSADAQPHRQVSHEAEIGVVCAVSSAGAVLLADRMPHGAEHLRGILVGSILSVRGGEILKVTVVGSTDERNSR